MIPVVVCAADGDEGKPRACGDDPPETRTGAEEEEVNPARAGMIPSTAPFPTPFLCKPRACGDDPARGKRPGMGGR